MSSIWRVGGGFSFISSVSDYRGFVRLFIRLFVVVIRVGSMVGGSVDCRRGEGR